MIETCKFPKNEKLTDKQGELLPPDEVEEYYKKSDVDKVMKAIITLQTGTFEKYGLVTPMLKIAEGFISE